jgi:hypothetical protein
LLLRFLVKNNALAAFIVLHCTSPVENNAANRLVFTELLGFSEFAYGRHLDCRPHQGLIFPALNYPEPTTPLSCQRDGGRKGNRAIHELGDGHQAIAYIADHHRGRGSPEQYDLHQNSPTKKRAANVAL